MFPVETEHSELVNTALNWACYIFYLFLSWTNKPLCLLERDMIREMCACVCVLLSESMSVCLRVCMLYGCFTPIKWFLSNCRGGDRTGSHSFEVAWDQLLDD